LPASSRTTRAVAEVLVKGGVILLHSGRGAAIASGYRAVDDIKPTLPFVQPQLMIGLLGRVSEIHSAPFEVEDTIRRGARH